jgi:hypothetical protein
MDDTRTATCAASSDEAAGLSLFVVVGWRAERDSKLMAMRVDATAR